MAPIAVPYWPALKQAVGSANAALVVAYLEMRYPSPAPESGRRYGLPVTVDFMRMADELAIDRRTLGLALLCVSTWYGTQIKRVSAVRAGREFVNLQHSRFPRLKLYSIVAAREWKSLRALTLRRNWPQLAKTLAECGLTSSYATPCPSSKLPLLPCQDLEKLGEKLSPFSSLPEILLRGVELGRERRKARHVRLRRAMKQGAEPVEVENVSRKPSPDGEAVAALGEELVARLSRRLRCAGACSRAGRSRACASCFVCVSLRVSLFRQ